MRFAFFYGHISFIWITALNFPSTNARRSEIMKCIVFEGEGGVTFPVYFPNTIMHRRLAQCIDEAFNTSVKYAGFFRLIDLTIAGMRGVSQSMGIGSDPTLRVSIEEVVGIRNQLSGVVSIPDSWAIGGAVFYTTKAGFDYMSARNKSVLMTDPLPADIFEHWSMDW